MCRMFYMDFRDDKDRVYWDDYHQHVIVIIDFDLINAIFYHSRSFVVNVYSVDWASYISKFLIFVELMEHQIYYIVNVNKVT